MYANGWYFPPVILEPISFTSSLTVTTFYSLCIPPPYWCCLRNTTTSGCNMYHPVTFHFHFHYCIMTPLIPLLYDTTTSVSIKLFLWIHIHPYYFSYVSIYLWLLCHQALVPHSNYCIFVMGWHPNIVNKIVDPSVPSSS